MSSLLVRTENALLSVLTLSCQLSEVQEDLASEDINREVIE